MRESDCVSFGWCFWHWTCYGCLFYGNGKLCTGERHLAGEGDTGPCQGRIEVSEPPLCFNCFAECRADELNEEDVIRMGLRRINAADGGLTSRRWVGKTKPAPWGSAGEEGTAFPDAKGMEGTGRTEGDGNFWVNINDPVHGCSFQPRPLKPFPFQVEHLSLQRDCHWSRPVGRDHQEKRISVLADEARACLKWEKAVKQPPGQASDIAHAVGIKTFGPRRAAFRESESRYSPRNYTAAAHDAEQHRRARLRPHSGPCGESRRAQAGRHHMGPLSETRPTNGSECGRR
ncbi:hypothetical protein AAL_04203 [Moelleriella libera RCEF 2490]|uniref:Uncharacterized protein n=1 Tax=Moelleriella libera RCEF 2490 TaxID=1081109 RepID=A0A168BYC9_9HYPO|nr:hypothetical protein AAL_04203 [Moelleriella libera RCEF 2490]